MNILKPKDKRLFNVKSKADLNIFKTYLISNAWGPHGCPFKVEEPYISIPDMLKDKITRHFLKI